MYPRESNWEGDGTQDWGGEAEAADTFRGMLAMSRWHVVSHSLNDPPLSRLLCSGWTFARLPRYLQPAVRVYTDSQGVILLNRLQGVQGLKEISLGKSPPSKFVFFWKQHWQTNTSHTVSQNLCLHCHWIHPRLLVDKWREDRRMYIRLISILFGLVVNLQDFFCIWALQNSYSRDCNHFR